ncbi:ATP-dependent DNA helicase DinG [soil metagenome]
MESTVVAAGELFLGRRAAEHMRREISRARGNEVCFLASILDSGEIAEPRVVARGNAEAVLAAIRVSEPGGLVLHNHPSGELSPSNADLDVAARLWEEGLGFAIVNNDASDLYVVVHPPPVTELEPLDLDLLDRTLGPGGPIARRHAAFEDRPDQRALTRLIGERYNEGGIAIAEAGTGTGKSMAYLLPAIRWALLNRERTVVSTNTINLQEQLVSRDLPFLRDALGEAFSFALVKGRNNYVSIRRARLALESAGSLIEDEKQQELQSLVRWLDATPDGSLSDLSFRPSAEVWDEVASESDVCLRAKCPHFEQCFYQRARREAASADVLVVNHHLLFADLAVRRANGNYTAQAVLPHYRRLIVDEAHNLEEAATQHLGATTSRRALFRVLRRLENRGKGVLPSLAGALQKSRRDLLTDSALQLIDERLLPSLEDARERGNRVFFHLETVLRESGGQMVRMEPSFAQLPVWESGLQEDLSELLMHLSTLLLGVEQLRERISVDEEARRSLEHQLMELRGAANRMEAVAAALRLTLHPGEDEVQMVRWLELRRDARGGDGNVILSAVPLDLSTLLKESVLEQVPTVVLTSATLATRSDFGFLRTRIGLNDVDVLVSEAIYPSPFDYSTQTLLAVPTDLPIPSGEGDRRHDRSTVGATLELAKLSDGGLFVLFTSYRALQAAAAGLRERGVEGEWPLLVHGEAPRAALVERFIESGRAILLGTTSFWEGVDVPGRPLRGLIIPRLPFKVPSDPVTAARVEAIEERGGNAFAEYMLPHAAIRLKQGFGRLIRSRTDRGAVLILDPRLASRSYGRYLLESLPPARTVTGGWKHDIFPALQAFYGRTPGPR